LPPFCRYHRLRSCAPHHRDEEFRYLAARYGEFPNLAPLLAAGTWVLAQVAADVVADVVADYFAYHGQASALAVDDMIRRLRTDLQMTASKLPTPLQ
jgi:hypothetical protein